MTSKAKQHRREGKIGVELRRCGVFAVLLVVFGGVAAVACGARTLEASPSDRGADNGGPSNVDTDNGGNGNTVVATTKADTTAAGTSNSSVSVGGGGGSESVVTSSTVNTTSGMLGVGACDEPYDLGSAVGSFSGITVGMSGFFSSCGGEGPDTFLLWTAPETGTYRVNTFESEIDTVLSELLRPNCQGLGEVQCNDDINSTTDSELLLYAVAGDVLTFVVDSFDDAGQFQLAIVQSDDPVEPCAPAFDELSGLGNPLVNRALPLDENTLNDQSADHCNGMAPRLAFDWKAPDDGTFSFDTFGSNYDTVLVLRADCNDTVGRLCNDDRRDAQSQLSVAAWAGQVIRVEVAAFGGNISTVDGLDPRLTLNVVQQ